MNGEMDIVVPDIADEKRDMTYAWQCRDGNEAERMCNWLVSIGIHAKRVSVSYFKGWEG